MGARAASAGSRRHGMARLQLAYSAGYVLPDVTLVVSESPCPISAAFSLAGEVMSRKPGTLILLLANLAFAMPALAQIRDPETLPQAQSANAKSLVAKALTAVDAIQWPAAEAALKQLVSAEPRWEYARRSQIAARAGASLPHQPIPDARP